MWYVRRRRGSALWRRFKRWRRRGLYRGRRRYIKSRYAKSRRRGYRKGANRPYRYKLVNYERFNCDSNGKIGLRSFTAKALQGTPDIRAWDIPPLWQLVTLFRAYRITKIKVEVCPFQNTAFQTAITGTTDDYTAPVVTVYDAVITDAGTLGAVPSTTHEMMNFPGVRKHSSVNKFTRVFTPACPVATDNQTRTSFYKKKWLRAEDGYDWPWMGWMFFVPNWNDSVIPGGDTWNGQGNMSFEIRYTVYIQVRWPNYAVWSG